MYAFRKPIAVATFSGMEFMGVDYKIWLLTVQVIGYMLSKFIGIKVISEMTGDRRAVMILALVGIAGLALLGFALAPTPWNIIFLFFNGLPLGMIWGLVFSYLEGRKFTEILGAGLCVSFIFSSGFVKTIGKWLMEDMRVSEFWMPLCTGLLFAVPLIGFVAMLEQIPPPSEEDERLRTKREPMNSHQRRALVKEFLPGLILLIGIYVLLTGFRDFRDNFMAEIWVALGYGDSSAIFTQTETWVSFMVLVVIGSIFLIKNNRVALMVNHIIILVGMIIVGVSTYAFEQDWLTNPVVWMVLVGLGLYLGYVMFNSVFFDRMLAAFRYVGNVGFLIYLADSLGYAGSVGVMFYKNFGQADLSWLKFFIMSCYVMAIAGAILTLFSLFYFFNKKSIQSSEEVENTKAVAS